MTPVPGKDANRGNQSGEAGEEERQNVDPVATAHRLVCEARKSGRLTRARFQRSTVGGAPDEEPTRVEAHLDGAGIAFDRCDIRVEGFSHYLDTARYPDSDLVATGAAINSSTRRPSSTMARWCWARFAPGQC